MVDNRLIPPKLNAHHGPRPPRPSVRVLKLRAGGRRLSRHPETYCCRRGTRWADRATTSSASPHSHVHHSSSPSWSGDSDVTQSQAQARHSGGATIKTLLSQWARRHAGMMPTLTGRHGRSSSYVNQPASAQARRPGKPSSRHAITQTRNQDTLKFRRAYPTAEG